MIHQIKRVHNLIYSNLCTINGTLDYDRLTDAFILLANMIEEYDGEDNDELWAIGEFTFNLPDMLVGAYWHFTEWHAGQASKSYQALCAIGQVYSPNMETVDEDNMIYQYLNSEAENV